MPADAPNEPAQMRPDLHAGGRLARPQDRCHALSGIGVIHVDRQEAAFIVMRVKQGELLTAMRHVERIVDVERHGVRRAAVALAPLIHQHAGQSQQRAQVWRVLPSRDGGL